MRDITKILPHSKKDAKLDSKDQLYVLNELCDLKGCSTCIFFEVRKRRDLYMWLSKSPKGPTAKFHVVNVHTMDELKLTGNCLMGARPILVFDKTFDAAPHSSLLKEMFQQTFAVPRGHKKSKPFVDHAMCFFLIENRIWVRHYQISEPDEKKGQSVLVEIGPRFVLTPILILSASFTGAVIYENPDYVSPNAIRSAMKLQEAMKYKVKAKAAARKKRQETAMVLPEDELDTVFAEEDDD